MNKELNKKVTRAIRLLQSIKLEDDECLEVAYSGGKDSDVILELVKMSGVKYRAIYKNTTIDPPGTIKHALDNGAEIAKQKKTFFELLKERGAPSMFSRFCCRELKEYKILDKVVIGVRRDESIKRSKLYKEPIVCKGTFNRKNYIQKILPILDWTIEDEKEFIIERGLKLHPLYYDDNGELDLTRRLGCIGCPLAYYTKRREQFKKYPKFLKLNIRALKEHLKLHPNSSIIKYFGGVYEKMYCNLNFYSYDKFLKYKKGLPDASEQFFKQELEKEFNISLD